MKNFKNWILEKKIILLRGVSGSGKSTLAKKLVGDGIILSTDDYFMKNGLYDFDAKKLGKYHRLNQEKTEQSMINGITPIIIDNTMSNPWEAKPYVNLADKYDYRVIIKELPVPPIEDLICRQEKRKNINKCLPKEVLEKLISRFKKNITLDDVRNS